MLRFKPEVRIGIFNIHLAEILTVATCWSALRGVELLVSSIADPAPNRVSGSLHPFDLAVDVEPVGNTTIDRQGLAEYFAKQLGPNYDVVFETSHVHIEYDMHRGPLQQIAG